jgi:hypothetical protein
MRTGAECRPRAAAGQHARWDHEVAVLVGVCKATTQRTGSNRLPRDHPQAQFHFAAIQFSLIFPLAVPPFRDQGPISLRITLHGSRTDWTWITMASIDDRKRWDAYCARNALGCTTHSPEENSQLKVFEVSRPGMSHRVGRVVGLSAETSCKESRKHLARHHRCSWPALLRHLPCSLQGEQ